MEQSSVITKYLAPWKYRRQQNARRLAEIRRIGGDLCSRCRRPIRFDLPDGHDQGPKIEHVLHAVNGGTDEIQNLCLTHFRCNAAGADNTVEAKERTRRKNEAELFGRAKRRA